MTGRASLTAGLIWFGQISVGGSYLGDILGPSLLAGPGLASLSCPSRSQPSQAFRNARPVSRAA
jgi:hypothetical protein